MSYIWGNKKQYIMKLRFIFSFLVALLLVGNVSSSSSMLAFSTGGRNVVLKGEIGTDIGRSAVPTTPPITAEVIDKTVRIQFTDAVGAVDISLDGEVQEKLETTTSGQEASISVEGYASGTYLLEFTNASGDCVYGELIVD